MEVSGPPIGYLRGIAIVALGAALDVIVRGWALALLWSWFAVPMGLPALGLARAYGLALVLRLAIRPPNFTLEDWDKDPPPRSRAWALLGAHVMDALLVLLLLGSGWVVKVVWGL